MGALTHERTGIQVPVQSEESAQPLVGMTTTTGAPGTSLFDLHLHLDWLADPRAFALGLARQGDGALGCTVTPQGYEGLGPQVRGIAGVRAALGLHPWYLGRPDRTGGVDEPFCEEQAARQLARFCELAQGTRFIGEVGLDFGRAHEAHRDHQVAALTRICRAVRPGSVVSLHAVRSAAAVLDVLESTGRARDCACVFHWFSGTSEELARARRLGCLFSVGPFMLRSKRGREYARQVPVPQLQLETDLPEGRGSTLSAPREHGFLTQALEQVAALKGLQPAALASQLAGRARDLLG